MKILAFDTSGTATSAAIWEDGRVLASRTFDNGVNHSTTLMPTIDEVMKAAGLAPAELTRIAVAQGPGSYTGLRIAVTAAKTLAWTLGIELVGVSSLLSLAWNSLSAGRLTVPLMNARRGFVYAGVYDENGGCQLADGHVELTELLGQLAGENYTFTGDAVMFAEEIRAKFPGAEIVADSRKLPSAEGIAEIAASLDAVQDVHNFNPIYLKKVEAEEKWEAVNGDAPAAKDLVSRA